MSKALKTALIKQTGEVSIRTFTSFKQMQQAVGGFIQAFAFGEKATAFVNEDGIAMKLLPNAMATVLCKHFDVGVAIDDHIKGNMIVIGNADAEGNETNIPDPILEEILRVAKEIE